MFRGLRCSYKGMAASSWHPLNGARWSIYPYSPGDNSITHTSFLRAWSDPVVHITA